MTYEQSIHERVWSLFQAYKTADAVMYHTANEGIRGPRERATFKSMGGVPGVPDFTCMAQGRVFYLEMKRPGGRMSEAQRQFTELAARHGVPTLVAYSVEEAVRLLQRQGVLRADIKFTVTREPRLVGARGGSGASASGPLTSSEATTAA